MKPMRIAYDGLEDFPKIDRLLIKLYIAYLFIIPAVSIVSYEYYLDQQGLDRSHNAWLWLFFLPVIMQIGFVINNLKVGGCTLSLIVLVFRIPVEVVLMTFVFGWNPFYGLSVAYALEIMGFCLGLTLGTVFRKASITNAHRVLSFVLAAGIMILVYFRFKYVFLSYIQADHNPTLQIIAGILCIVIAAFPYIRLFVSGKEDEDINMGTSELTSNLTAVMGISVLCYVIVIPILVFLVTG